MQDLVFMCYLKSHDMSSHFLKLGECIWGEIGCQNYISVWGLEKDVGPISFSKFSKQEAM